MTGTHNFGFSLTDSAGGKRGEAGGIFWRTERPFAYYADRIGTLTLADPLTASGRVAFRAGAPDSGMYLGWFSVPADDSDTRLGNFMGIYLEGPSRIGHYFRPVYATAAGSRGDARQGPVLIPDGRPHFWTLAYDPTANGGNGTVRVTLDKESVTLALKGKHREEGARFDRFGLLTARAGGSHVKVYFDDLRYTAGRKRP